MSNDTKRCLVCLRPHSQNPAPWTVVAGVKVRCCKDCLGNDFSRAELERRARGTK